MQRGYWMHPRLGCPFTLTNRGKTRGKKKKGTLAQGGRGKRESLKGNNCLLMTFHRCKGSGAAQTTGGGRRGGLLSVWGKRYLKRGGAETGGPAGS